MLKSYKKKQASPVKSSKEISSSKPKSVTKNLTNKEIQEPKAADKIKTSKTQIFVQNILQTNLFQK